MLTKQVFGDIHELVPFHQPFAEVDVVLRKAWGGFAGVNFVALMASLMLSTWPARGISGSTRSRSHLPPVSTFLLPLSLAHRLDLKSLLPVSSSSPRS